MPVAGGRVNGVGGGGGRRRDRIGRGDRSGSGRFANAPEDESGPMELNAHLPERFRGRQRNDPRRPPSSAQPSGLELSLNVEIGKYVAAQDAIASSSRSNAWLSLTEMPTNAEIATNGDEEVTLAPNKMTGRWKTKERYLRAHYELMREDAVTPLRDAVDAFRQDPNMEDSQSVSIYEKVHIAGLTFAQLGIAVRIRFSTARSGRKILWASSKRLTSGTIVALTPAKDKFSSKCIVAVVAARPLQGVELTPSEIDIYFSHVEDFEIDPQEEWIMIEAKTGYFEAYRHTLRALQKLSQESFPLFDYICSLSPEIGPPTYLQKNPVVNLSAVAVDLAEKSAFEKINILDNWPSSSGDALDKTQWAAMRQILTSCLSIVQGPPGTGKTHVSKTALQVLAENRLPDDPPIIIAAQTNHALDQLLGHVSVFDPNFIRLGGRSTNPEVKKRALYEVRQKERIPLIPGGRLGQSNARLKFQANKIIDMLEPLHRGCFEPFTAKILSQLGIITEAQRQSLESGAAEWVSAEDKQESPIQLWLNKALIPFEVSYKQNNFGFEEADEDLEFEQLKEQEAENGVADEEDIEMLKGQWCHLEDRFTVQQPSANVLDKAKRQLDTTQDLWKVPDYLRGPIYSIMQVKAKKAILVHVREGAREYEQIAKDLKVGKWERDAVFLQRANIIGLTTTGLSKYRPLIASLKPKIILIEEAAEVIEAPVTAACIESLEHLILVGDHQQLQGHCSVRDLEGDPYYLNVSMFERLVKNGMPFRTLLRQRRMDPEFRRLLMPIYSELEDHPAVVGRDCLDLGLGGLKSFFFDHEFTELKDSQLSAYNDKEAEFIAGFYKYLLKNGASSQGVTILTFYNGQRKRILKYLRDDPMTKECYNNVKTVDSYQGEENTIVILSLVRSNDDNKIGFLGIDNRVCVALSRAKFGFYLFGNAQLLMTASPLWSQVINIMTEAPIRIDDSLPITCKNHGRTKRMRYPEDWVGNDGGCDEPCQTNLSCGHVCDLKCHSYPHEKLQCLRECERVLVCSHRCKLICYEPCSCSCEDFSKSKIWMDEPGSGGGPSYGTQQPPRSGNGGGAWGSNNPGPAGDSWENGNPTIFNGSMDVRGNNHHTRSYGTQQRAQNSLADRNTDQIFAHALYRNRAEEPNDNRVTVKPVRLMGPPRSYHNAQASSSSATSMLSKSAVKSQSNTTYFQSYGLSSQHSFDKQGQGVRGWTGFANGGVKKEDMARAKQAMQNTANSEEKMMKEVSHTLIDLDLSDGSPVKNSGPVKSETVLEMGNGRRIYTHEFQPAGTSAN